MDLHRRDFTINTLALRLDGDHFGKIYDYWGGLDDLHKGQIRVLHALSFVDDATRLLRAVRFEQRFAFQIEPRTQALMEESLPLLDKLTGARLRHEINLILAEPKAAEMIERLGELGILTAIHPDLPRNHTLRQDLRHIQTDEIDPIWDLSGTAEPPNLRQTLSYLVWLGRLPEPTLASIVSRLRFKSDLRKLLVATSRLNQTLPELPGAKPSEVVQELEKAPQLALYAAYILNQDPAIRELLWQYVNKWAAVEPHTSGVDLREMGLPPSPAYGQILTTLRNAWLDGEIRSLEEEKALLRALVDAELKAHE
jgi:tRNA nucleotidyltransferase (CCA-adding enzyme)